MPITVGDNYWTKVAQNWMSYLMEEKIGDICKTDHYVTNTSWKYVLSVVSLNTGTR